MGRKILYFIVFCTLSTNVIATTRDARLTNTTGYNYNYMYPYLSNQMRTNLNPGVTPSQNSNLINTVVKTESLANTKTRRVVPRASRTIARAATTGNTGIARSGVPTAPKSSRRVVARSRTPQSANAQPPQTVRAQQSARTSRSAVTTPQTTSTVRVPSSRCLAGYTECMNNYCQRKNTKYNRCYCSARLSQIDSEYQPEIERLITEILTLQGTNTWTQAEMDEYWMDTIGKYKGENSWANLDSALNINWADLESRVRGQNAFNTGHEYCVQHLHNCYYMAGNLRDAYRSEIARDCDTYEQSLQKLKNAAQSMIKTYKN